LESYNKSNQAFSTLSLEGVLEWQGHRQGANS
jgi:hypothetical protein